MKTINALHIISGLVVVSLWFVPQAQAQTPPPPAPQGATASSQVTVTRSRGCVTVKVCPGPRCAAQAAPAPAPVAKPTPKPIPAPVPAPPPTAPQAICPAPPQMVCTPYAARVPHAVPVPAPLPAARKPLPDPARTRLGISSTAEVLGHGQWEILARGLGAFVELSVGLGNRFQLSFKTAPPTWFLPDLKLRDSLMAGELRAQIVRSRRFKLTADATYFHVASFHGLKLGLKAKIGTDKLALHAGIGAVMLFTPGYASDTCAGPVAQEDGNYSDTYDCGGTTTMTNKPVTILTANLGVEMRLWRYGKFFIDGFVAHMGEDGDNVTLFTLVPGMRFHSKGFAADVGIGVLGFGDFKIPLPVVNLSYRW